jgi:hypothetical protein
MRVLRPTLAPKTVFNEGTKAPPKVGPGTYKARLTVEDLYVAKRVLGDLLGVQRLAAPPQRPATR